ADSRSSAARIRGPRASPPWREREGAGTDAACSTSEIEAHERVLVADVDEPVGEGRERPQHARQHLRPRERSKRLRRCLGQYHLAAFADDEQPVTGESDAPGAELILTPL